MEETIYLLHITRATGRASDYPATNHVTQSRATASRRALTVARAIPNLRLQKTCELVLRGTWEAMRYILSHTLYLRTYKVTPLVVGAYIRLILKELRIRSPASRSSVMRQFSIQQRLSVRQESLLPKGRILNPSKFFFFCFLNMPRQALLTLANITLEDYFVTCPPKGCSATRHFFAFAPQQYSGKQ